MFQNAKNNQESNQHAEGVAAYSSSIIEIKDNFKKYGVAIFRAESIPEVADVLEAATTLEYLKPYANRDQTRGVIRLRDLTWQIDSEVKQFTKTIDEGPLKNIMAAVLEESSLTVGNMLLNNYSPGESLARHRDGEYQFFLKAGLIVYLSPTSDNALHIECNDKTVVNPHLKGGDCILLSPALYHWVEEVKTPRRSLAIDLQGPAE